MLRINIKIEAKNYSDVEDAINEVARMLREEYREATNTNEGSHFNFTTVGEEEKSYESEEAEEEL